MLARVILLTVALALSGAAGGCAAVKCVTQGSNQCGLN
jgi:hypothetical protein